MPLRSAFRWRKFWNREYETDVLTEDGFIDRARKICATSELKGRRIALYAPTFRGEGIDDTPAGRRGAERRGGKSGVCVLCENASSDDGKARGCRILANLN